MPYTHQQACSSVSTAAVSHVNLLQPFHVHAVFCYVAWKSMHREKAASKYAHGTGSEHGTSMYFCLKYIVAFSHPLGRYM